MLLCPPLICCQHRSSSSPLQVIEVLALLCLEPSSLLRSLRVKGGVSTGASKILHDLGLPCQHALSLGLPRIMPSSHRPPSHSVTHSMRQPLGLCACSSLCLECSCPDSLVIYSWVLFRPLFKCHAEKLSLFIPTEIGGPPQLSVPLLDFLSTSYHLTYCNFFPFCLHLLEYVLHYCRAIAREVSGT